MIKTYAEFLYPGIIVSETSTELVKSRKIGKWPKGAFGYRFYDREEVKKGKEVLIGKPKNHSNWTYKGRVMTLSDVEREKPDRTILISNMKNNGYGKIVYTEFGQAIPLGEKDKVVNIVKAI